MKKVAFYTLGCKVNQYETNAMIEQFIKANYKLVDFEDKSDIYIINTCTVTNMSDRKSRQTIRRVKQLNPNSILVVTGCYAQVAAKELEKIEEIDLIVGNTEKKDIVNIVEKILRRNCRGRRLCRPAKQQYRKFIHQQNQPNRYKQSKRIC